MEVVAADPAHDRIFHVPAQDRASALLLAEVGGFTGQVAEIAESGRQPILTPM